MDLKISKYRIYLHQFSNIVLGSSIIILLLSLKSASMGWGEWAEQIFIFLVVFGVIFHAWWRNAELFTTAKAKTARIYVVGVLRIVFVLMSLLWLRSISNIPAPHFFHHQILFGILAMTLWVGLAQQSVFIKPLYGKTRVVQKREYLTDLFFALSMTLYVLGLIFLPEIIFGFAGYAMVAICVGISRPIASASTPWTEPAPPHRGGRTRREKPQQYSGQRSGGNYNRPRSYERDMQERRRRKPVQNRDRDQDRSKVRNDRPRGNSSRDRQENRYKNTYSNTAEKKDDTIPEAPLAIVESNVNKEKNFVQENKANEQPENERQQYGRRRRGRKQNVRQPGTQTEQKESSSIGESVPESGASKESPKSVSSENFGKKNGAKAKYGRRKVKTRSEAGQKNENDKGTDAPKQTQEASPGVTKRQEKMN